MDINQWKESCRRLVEEMKPMTFWQKAEHIWTYYKEHMFMAFMALVLVVAVISSAINSNRQVLVSGVLCNLSMTMDGYYYMTEELFAAGEGDSSYQDAHLSSLEFRLPNTVQDVDTSYNASMSMLAMVEGKTVDYVLITEDALSYFLGFELFMDLSEFFTAEELEQLGDKIVYGQQKVEEDEIPEQTQDPDEEGIVPGEIYPMAVNITDMPFTKDCITGTDDQRVYFVVIINTPREEMTKQAWQFIESWGTQEES